MSKAVNHPLFARCYARMASNMELVGGRLHREELLSETRGRVIEVGAGTGLNFARYPSSVDEVIAVEPEDYLREQAMRAASAAHMPIRVVDGVAEELPFEDEEFDVGVTSLVLCSVSNPHLALKELRRVLRPGGELRFYEHVRSENPKRARWQDRANHLWPLVAGGCQTNRRTLESMREAGFEVGEVRHFSFQPSFLCAPISPFVIGRAIRR